MLRSAFLSSPSSVCKKFNYIKTTLGKWNHGNALRSLVTTSISIQQPQRLHLRSSLLLLSSRSFVNINRQLHISSLRLLSTSGSNTNNKSDQTDTKKSSAAGDGKQQSSDSNEIVLTPGETVVAVSRLTMYAGIAVLAAMSAYYIAMELIPT